MGSDRRHDEPSLVGSILAVAWLACFALALVFAVRGQPTAEAWSFSFGSGALLFFVWRFDQTLDAPRIVWPIVTTIGAVAVSVQAARSTSAWTRSGWILTAALFTAIALLAWRTWICEAPTRADERGDVPSRNLASKPVMAEETDERAPKGAYVPAGSLRAFGSRLWNAVSRRPR
jgi:hypothetical protein